MESKVATIWGEEIPYQLVILHDANKSYDGKALVVPKGEKRLNRVVINTAFFEKEALEIWKEFESEAKPAFQNRPVSLSSLDQLRDLKKQLQYAAWHPVYLKMKARHQGRLAKRKFVRTFCDIRMKTIEYHELSHVWDEKLLLENHRQEAFNALSETRAFITELAYGENPLDSLWQGVTGAIDEMKRGKNVDESLLKMKLVLEAAPTPLPLLSRSGVKELASLLREATLKGVL